MQYRDIFPPDFFSRKLWPHETIPTPSLAVQSHRCAPSTELHCPAAGPFAASVAAGTQNHPAASGAAEGQRALPATEHKHTNPNLVGQHLTFTGMPIFCQLEALPAVTLVGTINVGTLLAAGTVVTFIHICIQKQTHRYGHSASEQCFPPLPAPGDLYLPVRVTKEGPTCPYFFCSLGRMPASLRMSVASKFHFSICQWKHTHMQTLVSGFIGFSSL